MKHVSHDLSTGAGGPVVLSGQSRRRFLGRGATAAAALVLGPSFLAACGSSTPDATSSASTTPDDGKPATGTVRISNYPLYMANGFVAAFQEATGLAVDYTEDFNDNEEWFAKNKEPLSRHQDIGADLVVPAQYMAARLHRLGWLTDINHDRVTNFANLRPDLMNSTADPGRTFSAPDMAGMVGLAYNQLVTGRPITTIDDLWDAEFKGKVSLLSDMQDGLGMIMLSQGSSLDNPTPQTVQAAVDLIAGHKDSGQIRRFTGADYGADLAAGNIAIAQAYSGDVVQLQADNPDLEFVVPESGATLFIDTQVIPSTTRNKTGAEEWINYVYDRANYAKLVAFTQYVPVLSDMTDDLKAIDPKLAANPLINPPQATLDKLRGWPALSDEQTQAFNTAYALVTGS